MAAYVIPPALIGWFKTSYPTLKFAPDWIEACVQYLREHFPESTMPQLIKQVENQLLLSQLSTSTISTLSLLPHPLPDRPTTLFPTKAASVLLQVMAIEEIAQPALSLLRILKERQQLDKLRLANEGIDDAEKERRRARREGAEEDEAGEGEWVRGVMKFDLSDGHNSVKGVEWKRIPGFSLEETKLGCKILVQDVKIVNGILLLSPASVNIKGHSAEELEVLREDNFEQSLRARLRMPAIDKQAVPGQGQPQHQREPSPAPQAAPAPVVRKANQAKVRQYPTVESDDEVKKAMEGVEEDWGMEMEMEMDEEAEREFAAAERQAMRSSKPVRSGTKITMATNGNAVASTSRAKIESPPPTKIRKVGSSVNQASQHSSTAPTSTSSLTASRKRNTVIELDESEEDKFDAPASGQTRSSNKPIVAQPRTAVSRPPPLHKRPPIEVIEIDDSSDEG